MEYVEILRARGVLRNYGIVLLVGLVLAAASLYNHFGGHVGVHVEGGEPAVSVYSSILGACAVVAFIIATCIAPGLSAESSTLAITWTRPVRRSTIAWRFIAIDLATIAMSYAALFVVFLIVLAMFGVLGTFRFDGADAAATVARGLGCALMWYALVTLVTARLPGRGGMIAGLSWVAFLVLGGLWAAPFPTLIHWLIAALEYLNPMAYFGNIGSSGNQSIIPLSGAVRTLMTWCIGIAALVGTVRLWSTREV
jgi:hypothetical protein